MDSTIIKLEPGTSAKESVAVKLMEIDIENPVIKKECSESISENNSGRINVEIVTIKAEPGPRDKVRGKIPYTDIEIELPDVKKKCLGRSGGLTQTADSLTNLKTHPEKKRYSCPRCNYSCSRRSTLEVHLHTHSGEKSFSCPNSEDTVMDTKIRKVTVPCKCRLCLREITSLATPIWGDSGISDIVLRCSAVKVLETDEFQFVCLSCKRHLDCANKFQQMCLKSNEIFLKITFINKGEPFSDSSNQQPLNEDKINIASCDEDTLEDFHSHEEDTIETTTIFDSEDEKEEEYPCEKSPMISYKEDDHSIHLTSHRVPRSKSDPAEQPSLNSSLLDYIGDLGCQTPTVDAAFESAPGSRQSTHCESNEIPIVYDGNNYVLQVLSKSEEGRALLHQGRLAGGLLTSSQRKELTVLIIRHKLENCFTTNIHSSDFRKLAKDIGEIFSKESPATYYMPYVRGDSFQPKRNASGHLYNHFITRKRRFRELGILPPSSRSTSGSSTPLKESGHCNDPSLNFEGGGINLSALPEVETSGEDLNKLEHTDSLKIPFQQVQSLWASTIKDRLRCLYNQKESLKNYFDRFPVLKASTGYKLLLADFDKIYPNLQQQLRSVFSQNCEQIIKIAKSKLKKSSDVTIKNLINGYLACIDLNDKQTTTNVALILLAFIININPVRRKKSSWKATRQESRDGYITQVSSVSEIAATISERRRKIAALGGTLQPFIIYVGESIRFIGKVFVSCEDVLYEFHSLLDAVDCTFKIFHATAADYPEESYDIWLLIQLAFYNVKTKYDRPSTSLKDTIVDLGFKERI